MKHLALTAISLFLFGSLTIAQNKPAYKLYKNSGKQAKYEKMIKDLAKTDMVFFGEYHSNPISHWLQLEMTKSFYELKGDQLILGAEMFENGNQLVIDEYLKGLYSEEKMIPEITQMWGNYQTDYKPLMDFAKVNGLRFIATNIPRRYAVMINKMGMDALSKLSPQALEMISPDLEKYFDPTVKAYADMADMMGGHMSFNVLHMQMAQASKDATMAHFSLKNYQPGNLLFHFEGSYHSNFGQGIIWWINKIRPGLKIKAVTTVMQSEWDDMTSEEIETIADYIIVVANDMTKTNK